MAKAKTIPMKAIPKKVKPVLVKLPCKNVPDDERKKGVEVARLVDEIEAVDAEKALTVEGFKDKKAEMWLRMSTLRDHIRQGYEMRMVECLETYSYEDGTVTTVRLDNQEIHEKREMTDQERQLAMTFDEALEVPVFPHVKGKLIDTPEHLHGMDPEEKEA